MGLWFGTVCWATVCLKSALSTVHKQLPQITSVLFGIKGEVGTSFASIPMFHIFNLEDILQNDLPDGAVELLTKKQVFSFLHLHDIVLVRDDTQVIWNALDR